MNEHQNQFLPKEVILAECWLTMVSILLTTIQVCTDQTCLESPHLLI